MSVLHDWKHRRLRTVVLQEGINDIVLPKFSLILGTVSIDAIKVSFPSEEYYGVPHIIVSDLKTEETQARSFSWTRRRIVVITEPSTLESVHFANNPGMGPDFTECLYHGPLRTGLNGTELSHIFELLPPNPPSA